jgi:hypothetical protein
MTKKSELITAQAIIWGCAILATGIVLAGGGKPGVIIAVLGGCAGGSLVILTSSLKGK